MNQLRPRPLPLVVDLDAALVRTNLRHELFVASLKSRLEGGFRSLSDLVLRKASQKPPDGLDSSALPLDDAVLDLIRASRLDGGEVHLATACGRPQAETIAAHLGGVDGIFTDRDPAKPDRSELADRLAETFGPKGFDYVGGSPADLPVWRSARRRLAARAGPRVTRALEQDGHAAEHVGTAQGTLRVWLRAVRVPQYAKNALVFVPVLTAHAFTPGALVAAAFAFAAFCACASAVYLLNDLSDLDSDRRHPTKRARPFASGDLRIAHAGMAIPALLAVAFLCAILVSAAFLGVLLLYLLLTTAYSFALKGKMIVDVIVLAMLYTIRVVAGAVAIGVLTSEWLLAFSMFIFVALALIKRYVELVTRANLGLGDPSGRNYRIGDTPVIGALAAASAFNAITVFALYISSGPVHGLYQRPWLLWLICPVLMYWIARMLLMAHRGLVDDDPVVFALRDRVSQISIGLMAAIVIAATA